MKSKVVLVMIVAIGLFASVPLSAHHGGATLYTDRTVKLTGTVKTWLWSNPHCLLTMEVKGDDGQMVQWVAETQAPNSIYPSGYRKDSFKPGDKITVTLQPTKNGHPTGRLMSAILADGSTLGNVDGGGGRGGRGGESSY